MKALAFKQTHRAATLAIATAASLVLAGCGGMPSNRSLYSVHQPVVERANYTFDVNTGAGGLNYSEQSRLAGWFEAMDLRYGDRLSIDDPLRSSSTRAAVEVVASRYGVMVSDNAPTTAGFVNAGTARVIITRTTASVPGCPDWSAKSDVNLANATSTNYGCATNSNLAAMISDPEDLVHGSSNVGNTVVMSASKAIVTYREKKATGAENLKKTGTEN
ncbi:MAG: CpaD family pilus assembly protein [Novosphingobium sp.]|nr:CpaD family pilus assembly protein [Novosphingobium sp.]